MYAYHLGCLTATYGIHLTINTCDKEAQLLSILGTTPWLPSCNAMATKRACAEAARAAIVVAMASDSSDSEEGILDHLDDLHGETQFEI